MEIEWIAIMFDAMYVDVDKHDLYLGTKKTEIKNDNNKWDGEG